MTWLFTFMEYLCQRWLWISFRRHILFFLSRSFILTKCLPLVQQELITLPEYPSSTLVLIAVCVVQSLVFRGMCCGSLFIFYHLFGDCIVCLCFCYCIFSFSGREQVTLMSVLKKNQSRLIPKPSIVLILKCYAHSGETA